MTIAVLMTSYNRRQQTLACLESLFRQELPEGLRLAVYLTDDGSTDGTSLAVLERFPEVRLLTGDGSLFWNGGMRFAFAEALKNDHAYYLWLNDDTRLDDGALVTALQCHDSILTASGCEAIIVGTTRSPIDGGPTYGGVVRRSRLRRTRFTLLEPGNEPLPSETMNGNCVLIPREVAQRVGNLDETFVHGMGDFDYGLRARAAGFSIWVMPGYAGACAKNTPAGTFNDRSLSLAERWRRIRSPKGLPPREWRVFCRRHAGRAWWLYFFWPYVRLFFSSFRIAPHNKK